MLSGFMGEVLKLKYGRRGRIRRTESVSALGVRWAYMVFVMEGKHKQRLSTSVTEAMRYADTRVLNIADNYRFMDPGLIQELNLAIDPVLEKFGIEKLSCNGFVGSAMLPSLSNV